MYAHGLCVIEVCEGQDKDKGFREIIKSNGLNVLEFPNTHHQSSNDAMRIAFLSSLAALFSSTLLARACIKHGDPCTLDTGDSLDCSNCCSGDASQPIIGGSGWSTTYVSMHVSSSSMRATDYGL